MRSAGYIYPLDLVRFFSAIIVMLFHLSYSVWASGSSSASQFIHAEYRYELLGSVFSFGWVGVEVFFVLSGLVIARSCAHASIFGFIRSRVLRLYPAVWVCASITFLAVSLSGGFDGGGGMERYLRSLVLFPLHPWIDPVYWTLPVELSFYCLVLGLICLGRQSSLHTLAFSLVTVSLLWNFLVLGQWLEVVPNYDIPLQISRILMLDFGCFFGLGILLAMRSDEWSIEMRWGSGISLLACGLEIFNHSVKVSSVISENSMSNVLSVFMVSGLVWIVCIAIVSMSEVINGMKFAQKYLCNDYVRCLGLMTFPVYLLHFTLGSITISWLVVAWEFNAVVAFWLTISFILLLSLLVCRSAEPVVRRLLSVPFRFIESRD